MKFLLRWASRFGLLFGVPALMASSDVVAFALSAGWTLYVLWAARDTLLRHFRRLWALTSFRSYTPGTALRLGRLKGDTL